MFSAEPGPATTAALVPIEGEYYRLVVGRGEVLDTPELPNVEMHYFHFRPERGMEDVHGRLAVARRPHHFVINLGDHVARWRRFAELLETSTTRRSECVLERLREDVLAANRALRRARSGQADVWGNASGIDRDRGLVVIKPSGVAYEALTVDDMVVVDLAATWSRASGGRPPTRPRTWPSTGRSHAIGGIVHTHSTWATAWAQAQREIPLLGTTHADLCAHPIPVTRPLIARRDRRPTTRQRPATRWSRSSRRGPGGAAGALVRGHAPFCWGATRARRSTPRSRSRRSRAWRC